MYDLFCTLLVDAFPVVLNSPRSRIIRDDQTRRYDAKRLIEMFENLETVLKTATDLAKSANYYVDNDWPSLVAKRMRKDSLVLGSNKLREHLAELGNVLFAHLHRLDAPTRTRDSMNYLIGIRPMDRGHFMGAPRVAPVFAVTGDDSGQRKHSPLLLHISTDAVFKPKYGRKELKHYFDGDPSTFPFIRTVSLDDPDMAKPIVMDADARLIELTTTCSDLKKYIRSNVTIDDLLA